MGNLKNTSTGATSGGILGGPAGAIIGAGIGAFGDIASGILGIKSQKSANKTNLAIARETNQANERINERNAVLQEYLLKEQQRYNSFVNQRKMLEEAGYNPADLVANGASSAQSGLASAPTPIPQQSAQVSPIDYSSFGNIAHRAADLMSKQQSLERGEIAKHREETELGVELATYFDKIQKLRAQSDSALAQRDIDNLKVDYQRIINSHADEQQRAQIRNLFGQEFANYAKGGLDTILANIQSEYGGLTAHWQIQVLKKTISHMDAQIELFNEQGFTEQQMRKKLSADEYLSRMLGKLNFSRAEYQDLENDLFKQTFKLRKGLVGLDFLTGRETLSGQRTHNSLMRVFGAKTAEAKLEMINNLGNLIEQQYEHERVKTILSQKELDFSDVKNAVGITKDLVDIYKGLPQGEVPNMDDLRWKWVEQAKKDGYSRSDAKALFDVVVSPALLE